ncbi:hypothetical protein KKB99_08775, partial [bacterium]|nr:hypothetical protein [bacterium]MBU1026085.1 hypothetical protein [bacterium]
MPSERGRCRLEVRSTGALETRALLPVRNRRYERKDAVRLFVVRLIAVHVYGRRVRQDTILEQSDYVFLVVDV